MTRVFTLAISLTEPLILTDGSSDSAGGHETLSYIPGTSVLGALVGALGIDPKRDPDRFARLFLDESTRFLNAYPALDHQRTLPRPKTFRQGKARPRRVIDRVTAEAEFRTAADLEQFLAGDRMKTAKPAFILPASPGIDRSPRRQEQVHVGIDRATRAAQEGVLFTYESLAAGTRFYGGILVDDAEAAAFFEGVGRSSLQLRIGRSRGGGYGAAEAVISAADAGWREYEQTRRLAASSKVIACLLSDFLPALEQPPVAALEAALRVALGVPHENNVHVLEAGLRTVRGFRGVWGLPRPARTAVERGSVVIIDGPLDPERVAALELSGIGCRRNEGFGRVSLGWTVHGSQSRENAPAVEPASVKQRPSAAAVGIQFRVSAALDQRRGERLRRRFVETVVAHDRVRKAINDLQQQKLPPAQLGNLRAAMTGGLSEDEIGRWFADIAQKTAGERWRQTRVRGFRKADQARRRNGIGFVWTNLLGGTTDRGGRSDDPQGQASFRTAVELSLVPWCCEPTLCEAAIADPDRTLRLFVVAFCSDIVRARNVAASDVPQEAPQ